MEGRLGPPVSTNPAIETRSTRKTGSQIANALREREDLQNAAASSIIVKNIQDSATIEVSL
jgi:hypothetical protein